MLNTDILFFCTHFLVEIDEKYSHNGGFKYDYFNDDEWVAYDMWLTFLGHLVYLSHH